MTAATSLDAAGERIEGRFREVGVTGHLYAADIDTGREIAVRGDALVVLASVFKVPLLVTLHRLAAAGAFDLAEAVTLPPEGRTSGPTGISAMLDEVRMSLRDLSALMITVSDNAAGDVLYARVGPAAVNAAMDELGLHRTRVVADGRELHDALLRDAGVADFGDLWERLDEPGLLPSLRVLDPERTNRSTPREIARLLASIWRDEAAPADACAQMRRLFGLQVWPHRLSSGFPFDDVRVSGKTGTLPTIRNEVGVVEYPDGGRYAVAVFTRSLGTGAVMPEVDAAIGTTARMAVEALRS
ncbi:serine hydrolase [Actinomadura sp. 21ATH]|uniref:serine hydrolase n=1 Tax=Actinomadura sp. 21ATH TaxID=1735444 RepID=UPI0035BEBB12